MAFFNHHFPPKYDVHRFYVERCLNASSIVIPGALSGRSNGSVRRHNGHIFQRIFSSSCSLIKCSGTALLLLYLSGDLELNPGPVERSRANLRHSLRPRCSTCSLVFKRNVGYVTCSECTHPFHLNCIGPQFEKFRSCLNCSTVSSTADFDDSGVFQDIPDLSNLTSQRGLKFLYLNVCSLLPKVDELRLLLLRYKDIDFFPVTETHLSPNISDGEIGIPGYTIYRLDRQAQSKGGGVLVYVRNCVSVSRRYDLACGSCILHFPRVLK